MTDGSAEHEKHTKPRIAVFSGPTATILRTPPLVTSGAGIDETGEFATSQTATILRAQRLAAPVSVYIHAYSAHPLEEDAKHLYAAPDGYLDHEGQFRASPTSDDDIPVYVATLEPEDGLYLLPYVARKQDGGRWLDDCSEPGGPMESARQSFYPDASRLFEEIDRFGLNAKGINNQLSVLADYEFFRAAPSGGYTRGQSEAERTDSGSGDIASEQPGVDFFYYSPRHLAQDPPLPALANLTNIVTESLRQSDYLGAIWLEGSPGIEETMYWLNLLIDTKTPICGNASQRPHGSISNDGDRNLVNSALYLTSRVWSDDQGRDAVGGVVIQDERIFTAREVQKIDERPGGYMAAGGHGGVVGNVGAFDQPQMTFWPTKRHTWNSDVNLSRLPDHATGVRSSAGRIEQVDVTIKAGDGQLLEAAMPKVTIAKYSRYGMDTYSDAPDTEVEILARIARNLTTFPLAGFVLEGNTSYGRGDETLTAVLQRALHSGMPTVKVCRGNSEGFVPSSEGSAFVTGSNLTATKARLLMMACLLKFGSAPPAVNPSSPTSEEKNRSLGYIERLQQLFDTH